MKTNVFVFIFLCNVSEKHLQKTRLNTIYFQIFVVDGVVHNSINIYFFEERFRRKLFVLKFMKHSWNISSLVILF